MDYEKGYKTIGIGTCSGNLPLNPHPVTQAKWVGPMASLHNSLLEAVSPNARPQIEALQDDILRSAPFRTSRQCQDLFRYIVGHSLAGSDDSLRERVIGIEVFGRAPGYDTAEDPVVRLRAADVRKRLAQYYQSKTEPGQWKIEIPTGSYKAQFHAPEIPLAPAPVPVRLVSPEIEPLAQRKASEPKPRVAVLGHRRFWLVAFAALCLITALAGFSRLRRAPAVTAFDLFWGPVLETSRPVYVCTGSNRVYILSQDARARYRKSHLRPDDATPNLETLVPKEDLKKFGGEDFVPVKDTYLTVGDAAATAQVSSLLTSRHHAYDLRFGNDLSFGDLREGSAVLIGAFNNSWTLSMTDNLRFVFDAGDTPQMHVRDRFDASRSWKPQMSGTRFLGDYAIISRILDSKTGAVLITIAGLDHTGTRAAGEFATSPELLNSLMKAAPKDWNKKNLQILLHTDIVSGIPSTPTVVATYYW